MSENSTENTETVYERPNPATTLDALRGTKQVLQQQGRTRGMNFRYRETGILPKVCLNGAALVATGFNKPTGAAYPDYNTEMFSVPRTPRFQTFNSVHNALNEVGKAINGVNFFSAIAYNDGTATDEDVYALIDEAIAAQPTTSE